MKKNLIYTSIFSMFVMASCGTRDWDVSKFNIKPDALKDGEEVKVLYVSRSIDFPSQMGTDPREFSKQFLPDSIKDKYDWNNTPVLYVDERGYTQLVAISQSTNDTVNILTLDWYDWAHYNNETLVFHAVDYETSENGNNKIEKVARGSSKFDYLANNYPAVIGRVSSLEK